MAETGEQRGTEAGQGSTAAPGAAAGDRRAWAALPAPLRWIAIGLVALFLWYGVLGAFMAGIRTDVALRPSREMLPTDGSVTVGMLGALLEAQVDGPGAFAANDPFFYPTGFARKTAAFETRVIDGVRSTAQALATRHPSKDLDTAVGELSVPANQWWISLRWPFFAFPAERHYQAAIAALGAFNRDLAGGEGSVSRKGEALPAGRLGEGSRAALEALERQLADEAERGDRVLRGLDRSSAGVQLARARGTAYVAAMVLRGLQEDNGAAIRQSGMAARWGEARDALDEAAAYSPLFVQSSDLRSIGYSLLIANNALHAILAGD